MKTKICTAINRNVPNAEPLQRAGGIPAGWITRLTQPIDVLPVDIRRNVRTAARKRFIPMKTVICTAITQRVMDAEANWMAMVMLDGAIIPSAAIPVLSAVIRNPVPIPTAEPCTPITAVLSIKWHRSAVIAESPTIPRPNLIHGTTAIGNPSLLPSMSAQNPATAADLPRKQSPTPSAETSAPDADTVKKQRPL